MTSFRKDGEYYYARKGRCWGVWQFHRVSENYGYGSYIGLFDTKEEARAEVFNRNGWELNKNKAKDNENING